jgi:hypothetical protein
MVKCSVFFAVRTELLNIIYASFGFKGLKSCARLEFSANKVEEMHNIEVVTVSASACLNSGISQRNSIEFSIRTYTKISRNLILVPVFII